MLGHYRVPMTHLEDTMRLAKISIALVMMLGASLALAENWVIVVNDFGGISVDKDSIRLGSDHLVYFTKRTNNNRRDSAVDCQNRVDYSLKLYVRAIIIDNPNWRNEGQAIQPGTNGDLILQYVCANAP